MSKRVRLPFTKLEVETDDGAYEVVTQPLHQRSRYPTGGVDALRWFDKSVGTASAENPYVHTSMDVPNQLPRTKHFLCASLAVSIIPGTKLARDEQQCINDWRRVSQFAAFDFRVADRIYLRCPASFIPVVLSTEPMVTHEEERLLVDGRVTERVRRVLRGFTLDPPIHIEPHRYFEALADFYGCQHPVAIAFDVELRGYGYLLRALY